MVIHRGKIIISGIVLIITLVFCTIVHHAYLPIKELKTNFENFNYVHDENAIKRFMGGLRFATISWSPGKQNVNELLALKTYIKRSYPQLHSSKSVRHEVINNCSLLFIIKGRNSSLSPAVFMAHSDVVPTNDQIWDSDPFDPRISDGFIYARGTIDDKGALFGILEAAETLLSEGHQFERDVILAFGHDEEISGYHGAASISRRLHEMGYRHFEFIIDEGLVIVENLFPGVERPFALIGTSQKGLMHVNLSVEHAAGHASMPGRESAIGIIARALKRLEDNPFPNHAGHPAVASFFSQIAREMSLPKRLVLSNLWLFRPLVAWIMSRSPETNSIIRTTVALTVFHAGVKENVLPSSAWAVVNCRVHPGDSVPSALEYLRHVVDDPRVQMSTSAVVPPMGPAQGRGAFGFDLIEATVRQLYPDVMASPGLMMGNTDTPWYSNFTKNIYYFNPVRMDKEDVKRFHGRNERIRVDSFRKVIEFYYRLMRNMKTFTAMRQGHSHESEL